jgi:membrane protease YdiL (CAAX protease family)
MLKNNLFYQILVLSAWFFFGSIVLFAAVLFFNSMPDINPITLQKILQAMQAAVLFIIPAYFTAQWVGKPNEFLRLKSSNYVNILLSVLFAVIAIPAINYIAELNTKISLPDFLQGIENWAKKMETDATLATEQMLSVSTIWGLLINILIIGLLAAFGEEIFFRGFILKALEQKMNYHIAIWVSAIIFSAIHLQFFGFVPRMFLGAAFGYMAVWSGSLWLPVTAHFINNTIGVVSFYLIHNKLIPAEANYSDYQYPALSAVFLLFSILILILIKNNSKK